VELVPYQVDDLERRFPMVAAEACAREIHVIEEGGRVHRGARGAVEVIRRLGPIWRILAPIMAHPPVLWVAKLVYAWVARNRHRLGSGTCEIERP
jgi:predicted DCC family thiol-disulfide oxidoreductase YuxK